eukprot:5528306-Pyramimonas_sp.AAC.1
MRRDACVARPATKAEVTNREGATAALKKEWDRSREIDAWDMGEAMELSRVRKQMGGKTFHIGRRIAIL